MALAAVYGATILKVLPQLTTPKVLPPITQERPSRFFWDKKRHNGLLSRDGLRISLPIFGGYNFRYGHYMPLLL